MSVGPAFVVLNDHWLPHFGHAHVTKYFLVTRLVEGICHKIQRPDRQVSCKVCGPVVTVNILPWFCFIEKFKYNKFNLLNINS